MSLHSKAYLAEVASRTIDLGGSASRPSTGEFLPDQDLWCFPKYPSKTAILPFSANLPEELQKFIVVNSSLLNQPDCWLGTWLNPNTRDFYLDIATGVEDFEEAKTYAIQAGKTENRQVVAIFNPLKKRTIFLNS